MATKQRNNTKKGPGRIPYTHTSEAAGSKMIRRAAKGLLTLRHPGGIVSEAFRNMARQRHDAKQ